MAKHQIQIDVISVNSNLHTVTANLYTGNRCVRITLFESDYKSLIRDGFFVRSGASADSAGVLNTTNTFTEDI